MQTKWFRKLFRRRVFVILMLAFQLFFAIYLIVSGSLTFVWINRALYLISYLVVLYVTSKNVKAEYKIIWIFLILLFPIFGGLLYLFFNFQSTTKKFRAKLQNTIDQSKDKYFLPQSAIIEAEKDYTHYKNTLFYLEKTMGFPVYSSTKTKYLSPGEEKFKYLLDELKKAEKYIFLEYFIIQEGYMWNTILDILKEKAAAGVDVRLIYDDLGCFLLLPKDYPKTLEQYGIKCLVFNKFKPVLTSLQNNRDHRKIALIDGKVAFTGGINLSDEYINRIQKHGHWKDASIMVSGKAAWSLTVMFLEMWSVTSGENIAYDEFYPYTNDSCDVESDGYVQPYYDSPIDEENVGESVYLNIINLSKHYLYINTPYLVIDDSMMNALKLAAKNGVDVRIVTPRVWDKRFVHITTRSYYPELIKAGVKIYEYNGFIHSKTFVSDDKIATVGTTNLDFRSLYLHFECGAVMYGSSAVKEVYTDFVKNLDNCFYMTLDRCKCNIFVRLIREILRLLSPLM